MRKLITVVPVIICVATLCTAQQKPSQWQTGSIIKVASHTAESPQASEGDLYDVSVQVGKTVYVVLYNDAKRYGTIKYKVGQPVKVLVEKDSMTFNNLSGVPSRVTILSSSPAPAK